MPRISKKASVTLSLVLAFIFLAALAGAAVIMPGFVRTVCSGVGTAGQTAVTVIGYLALADAAAADLLLIALLRRVRNAEVFTDRTVALIRGVSWCCFIIGALALVLTLWFLIAWAAAFAAILLGLALRAVKNAFEEAICIKSENDLTV